MEYLTQTYESDILIIGGGIAGISAAITAKETEPSLEILIVDKATASKGWAGKSARTAGLLSFVTAEDDPEEFVKYCLDNIGFYLNDQTLLREYAFSSGLIAENLTSWGVDVLRQPNGKLDYSKWPFPFGTGGVDPDMCRQMSAYANKLGVKFLDKVVVVDLLKDEGRIAGAVGFSILNGDFHVFRAKSIILANGSQNYDMTPVWCSTGNGIAAAYRAGAEMRNAEFGNMCDFARLDRETGIIYYAAAHTAHDYLFNVKGEHISQKYRPGLHSSMDPIAALAWYRETLAGNGPIFTDLDAFKTGSGHFFKHHPKATQRMGDSSARRSSLKTQRFEVIPGFIGELSCVRVDHQMATSIPGLFAVGDVSGSGSARAGAVPAPPAKIHGTGILNALFMGMKGGPSAAVYAQALKKWGINPKLNSDRVKESEKIYAPIKRQSGISPHDIIHKIQEVIAPVDYGIIKRGDRIEKALTSLLSTQQELKNMKANDYHELAKCLDAESMALGAELFHRASLMRTESRGFHYREDYPDMDNEHWLKWIILRNENSEMKVYTEDIPIHKYPYKPPAYTENIADNLKKGKGGNQE
jgi:succinate dehydrogenase / fumarate reductase flavoprotein subunit